MSPLVKNLQNYKLNNLLTYTYYLNLSSFQLKLEKVDLVITDTPSFQILNEAMKRMKHVVIYLTTYSFRPTP
jgi:hypothetical protein